jgi:hypothetical protein
VSKPAARFSTQSQPSRTAAATKSSISFVRAIIGQPLREFRGISFAIASPRSPASRSANGSENSASGRWDSQARYTATQSAVSET